MTLTVALRVVMSEMSVTLNAGGPFAEKKLN